MAFELGGGKARVRPSMNVTPLVDVVLVLLIIFMVITPLMTKQFYVHVPKKETKAVEKDDTPDDAPPPIVLTVRADGTIWINKDQVGRNELVGRLERIFAARTENVMFFDAADTLPYGRAMEILDLARGGGAVSIAVLTDPVAADDDGG